MKISNRRQANVAIAEDATDVLFDFVCEGCGAEGRLGVKLDQGTKPFGCPVGCGATYVLWRNLEGKMQLTCVVCPMYD